MTRFPRAAGLIVTAAAIASAALVEGTANAETVGMYGEYHQSSGLILDLPRNPPIVPCVPPPRLVAPAPHATVMGAPIDSHVDLRPTGVKDARCHDREQHVNHYDFDPGVFRQPQVGNRGARVAPGGVNVGDPFTIPPFAFRQQLGPQIGFVLQNVTRQLDTTFIAAAPGIDRIGPNPGPLPGGGSYTVKTPAQLIPAPALTRMFSSMNWANAGNGQNNGKPGSAFAARAAADTTHFASAAGGNEKIQVRYKSGPRQFGGTMAILLDGPGRSYLTAMAGSSGMFPALLKPTAATVPIGDNDPGLRVQAAAGWDLTHRTARRGGKIKSFLGGANPANLLTPMGAPRVAPPCVAIDPQSPAGCNEINGFDTFMAGAFSTMTLMLPPGGTLHVFPNVTTIVHQFALTTGTVSLVRVALRNGVHFSDTLTGMGHDTLEVSSMGGPFRNVGLVAGSYSVRRDTMGSTEIHLQMVGLNLKFVPEPRATVALVAGLAALTALAFRSPPNVRTPRRARREAAR